MNTPILSPSLLAGSHANLKASLAEIEATGVSWVHLDIMDGHFVPNISFGPQSIQELRACSKLFFDVHLMLSEPHHYIDAFHKAGANHITIHVEPHYPITDALEKIQSLGMGCGICVNPDTDLETLEPYWTKVDLVLLMTVQPGFGGQAFRKDVLSKIEKATHHRQSSKLNYRIEVDGGIDLETVALCKKAGADTFVAGTAFFKATARHDFINAIQSPPSCNSHF